MEDTIMKKTYINPELQVIVMQTAGMLAQSIEKGSGNINPNEVGAPEYLDEEQEEELDW
jgi:hypothetical protein